MIPACRMIQIRSPHRFCRAAGRDPSGLARRFGWAGRAAGRRAFALTTLACLLAALPGPLTRPAAAATDPARWVEAFWAAYTSASLDGLARLFSPSATVQGRPVDQSLATLRTVLEEREALRAELRGELQVTPSETGAAVRARVALSWRARSTGRQYRQLSVYDWVLVREEAGWVASMMTFRHEPEPDLPVTDVRIATHAQGGEGRPAAMRTRFGSRDPICLVVTLVASGGHVVMMALHAPDGRRSTSPPTYVLAPIDRVEAVSTWRCARTAAPWPAGSWTATAEVDGRPAAAASFTVEPAGP